MCSSQQPRFSSPDSGWDECGAAGDRGGRAFGLQHGTEQLSVVSTHPQCLHDVSLLIQWASSVLTDCWLWLPVISRVPEVIKTSHMTRAAPTFTPCPQWSQLPYLQFRAEPTPSLCYYKASQFNHQSEDKDQNCPSSQLEPKPGGWNQNIPATEFYCHCWETIGRKRKQTKQKLLSIRKYFTCMSVTSTCSVSYVTCRKGENRVMKSPWGWLRASECAAEMSCGFEAVSLTAHTHRYRPQHLCSVWRQRRKTMTEMKKFLIVDAFISTYLTVVCPVDPVLSLTNLRSCFSWFVISWAYVDLINYSRQMKKKKRTIQGGFKIQV